jgi:archaemetzincin
VVKYFSILLLVTALFAFIIPAKDGGDKLTTPKAKAAFKLEAQLKPLQSKLPIPKEGDWLHKRNERGQTLTQYIQTRFVKASSERNKLYIRLLGTFNKKERKVIEITAEYLQLFFGLETKILDSISLKDIPKRKVRYKIGTKQVSAWYLIQKKLRPNLPGDAAAMIGFTTEDLHAPVGNYVFGLATIKRRVGVWSIHRFGNPSSTQASFKKCLLRTMKTAAHETGHMFTLYHCIAHHCMMNGANHLDELDSEPPHLCSACTAKLQYNLGFNAKERFAKLKAFWEKYAISDDGVYFGKAIEALE